MKPDEQITAFISYQRADTLFAAHALGYAIRAAGHKAFVDTGSIGGGELFPQEISGAIEGSNVMLSLIGPNFNVSRLHEENNFVRFEWRRARFHNVTVIPVLVDEAQMPQDDELPDRLNWFTKRNAYSLRRSSLSGDIESLIAELPRLGRIPERASRVMWVDDRPSNNEFERKVLRSHGIIFDNVVSTDEALDQLFNESYDLVITDYSRNSSSDQSHTAGASLLEHPDIRKKEIPIIIYAGDWISSHRDELVQRGAKEATASQDHLIATVLDLLDKDPEAEANLKFTE